MNIYINVSSPDPSYQSDDDDSVILRDEDDRVTSTPNPTPPPSPEPYTQPNELLDEVYRNQDHDFLIQHVHPADPLHSTEIQHEADLPRKCPETLIHDQVNPHPALFN